MFGFICDESRLAATALLSLILLATCARSIEIIDQTPGPTPSILLPVIATPSAPDVQVNRSSVQQQQQLPLTNEQVRWAVDLAVSRMAGTTSRKSFFIIFSFFFSVLHQLRKRSYIAVTSYDKELVRRDVRMKGEGIFEKTARARALAVFFYKKSCKCHSGLFCRPSSTNWRKPPLSERRPGLLQYSGSFFSLQVGKVILEKRVSSSGKGISSGHNRNGDAVSFRSTSNLAHIQQELSDR